VFKDIKTYLVLFSKYNKKNIGFISLGLRLGIIAQLCTFFIPFLSKFIIDDVIIKGNFQLFKIVFLVSLAVFLLLFISGVLSNYILVKMFSMGAAELTMDVFRKLQYAPMEFFCPTPSGEIAYRMLTDTQLISNSWISIFGTLPINFILLISGIFLAIWYKTFVLFIFLIIVLQALIVAKFRKPLLKYSFLVKEKNEEITGYAVEHFQKIELVRSLSTEKLEEKKFYNKLMELIRTSIKSFMLNQYSGIINVFVNNLWFLGVLWYGGIRVINGEITLGTLMAVLLLTNILLQPVLKLTNLVLSFQDIRASLLRVLEYLELKPKPIETNQTMKFVLHRGSIKIENLSFSYNTRTVLKNINLEIPHKSIFALVGPSGVGKTTLAYLLVRFYELQEGSILLDGVDIRSLPLSLLRKNILLVLQNSYVFNGTLLENITYGLESVDKTKLLTAIKNAGIDFIDKLPHKLHTIIGVDGRNLSVGEAQRVALARAFLYGPKVLILDEPTAFLDVATEEKIKKVLLKLKETTNVILIAHRLSTVMIADQVAVMNDGKVIEVGNPKELLNNKNSIFFSMANSILAH